MAMKAEIYASEIFILRSEIGQKFPEVGDDEIQEALRNFQSGQYVSNLSSSFGKRILKHNCSGLENFGTIIHQNVKDYLSEEEGKVKSVRQLEVLLLTVSSLQLFIQNNWVGPVLDEQHTEEILPDIYNTKEKVQELKVLIEEELSVDGEPIYSLSVQPVHLYIAWVILSRCREQLTELQTTSWWLLRCLRIQQEILDSKSSTLQDSVLQLLHEVQTQEPLMTDDNNRDLLIQFHLEAGYLCHMYYKYQEAREHVQTAQKTVGITIELTGIMGKKTRFQQEDKAQLIVKVTRDPDSEGVTPGPKDLEIPALLPKCLTLDDDTVLDAVQFQEGEEVPYLNMTALEQAVVFNVMEDFRRSRAEHEKLTLEELQAYIACVLQDVKNWSVSVVMLLQRSRIEKNSSRRVERSMMQLEELVKQTHRQEPSASERLSLFYSVSVLPVWNIQMQLAELLISLGAIGSALEIFERLEMWEMAISCYQRMGKTEKAETMIREQLAVKETPNLWCYLGDVTHDLECYEKAWEMSNHRSARAQRCMAYLYFAKEEYEKCLECFEKSLSINTLQVPVWFTYGCAAMAANQNSLAVRAFKRCVAVDYDNYEAWNNMASAYIKLKEKYKAYMTLGDALKCNYDNWRIWDNFLVVSCDCGEFSATIRAYHRLMDLKDKWEDTQVLRCLVRAVTENMPDRNGQPAGSLKQKLLELFGRITAKITGNGEIWHLYALLCGGEGSDTDKVLQLLQKAHRSVMQTANWEKDSGKCVEIGVQSLELADTYVKCSSDSAENTKAIQLLSSAKLMLRGILTKIKQAQTDPISQTLAEPVKETCANLDDKLNAIIQQINELKAS